MKNLSVVFLFLLLWCSSCKKCKQCYLDETKTSDGTTVTTYNGEICGKELEQWDGKIYQGSDGPVSSYCK